MLINQNKDIALLLNIFKMSSECEEFLAQSGNKLSIKHLLGNLEFCCGLINSNYNCLWLSYFKRGFEYYPFYLRGFGKLVWDFMLNLLIETLFIESAYCVYSVK